MLKSRGENFGKRYESLVVVVLDSTVRHYQEQNDSDFRFKMPLRISGTSKHPSLSAVRLIRWSLYRRQREFDLNIYVLPQPVLVGG